jgi:hypothetical protein
MRGVAKGHFLDDDATQGRNGVIHPDVSLPQVSQPSTTM